jgi:hydrogenase nickel incorporation protein HypA/HybF
MHELSLAQSICDTVKAHIPPQQNVVSIVVEWGPLSGIVPESLQYCFSVVASHSGLEGARLELRQLSAKASCPSCGANFEIDNMWAKCDLCGQSPVTVTGGREFTIREVVVSQS